MSPKESEDCRNTADLYRQLLCAIETEDVTYVESILSNQWQGEDRRNRTLFDTAVKRRQPAMVRCLLRHRVIALDESPLFLSIKEVEILQTVLAEGYAVDVVSSVKKRPLHVAVSVKPAAIPILLQAGSDVTARDLVHGNTPLHVACSQYQEEAVVVLIQSGAWLNVSNWAGESPLYCLLKRATGADFHSKSRRSLARCLVHAGMTLLGAAPRTHSQQWLQQWQLSVSSHQDPMHRERQQLSGHQRSESTLGERQGLSSLSSDQRRMGCVVNTSSDLTNTTGKTIGSEEKRMSAEYSASARKPLSPAPVETCSVPRRPDYKVCLLYRQLLSEARSGPPPLQHLCRLAVRAACESGHGHRWAQAGEGGDPEPSFLHVLDQLDLPHYLKHYLLFTHHPFQWTV